MVGSRPSSLGRAVAAEWVKVLTSPGASLTALAAVIGTVAVTALVALTVTSLPTCSGPACDLDLPKLGLTGLQLGQAVVAVLAVGVMGDEYGSSQIVVTLSAVPRRGRMLVAKAVVTAVVAAVTAVVAVAGSVVVGQALLPGHQLALRPAVGSVLYLVLVALLALGAATAVCSSAGAVGVVLALLYAAPLLSGMVADPVWNERLQRFAPASAGMAVQSTTGDAVIGPVAGLGVLALWALASLLIGAALLRRRDA